MAEQALAQNNLTPEQKSYLSTRIPDRVVLTWRRDPARSQTVTWRTSAAPVAAFAEYALAAPGPEFTSKTQRVQATTTPLRTDLGEAHFHTADLEPLSPNTRYYYRVGDGVHWSEWSMFQTASDQAERFSFLYFGDAQHAISDHWSHVIREAHAAAPRAKFMLHAGDLVNVATRDSEWGQWFAAASYLPRVTPVLAIPGNHELTPGVLDNRELVPYWHVQFPRPENGPKSIAAFTLDIQGVRLVCLDSNDKRAEQAEWLERVLSDNPNRWTVVAFHHPLFTAAAGRDNKVLREQWMPILDRHRVDLVLQGHDHSYARSGLLGDVNRGTVFVISVSGPGMYSTSPHRWMRRVAQGRQLFQIITVGEDTLQFAAHTADGVLFDGFELRKQGPGQPNLLVDTVPPPPEGTGLEKLQGIAGDFPGATQAPAASRTQPAAPGAPMREPWWTYPALIALMLLLALGFTWLRRRTVR